MAHSRTPELMPVLSRGKHRNPRKGACFMELASYLAGEKWSDHPDCTHPLLAALARDINDHIGDEARRRIAPLIPEVIGLNKRDPRIDVWIAREVAMTALPVVSSERQGVAAVGLLRCERVLNELEGRPKNYISSRTLAALAQVPQARDWARSFSGIGWGRPESFTKRSAPAIIHSAVSGIAVSAVEDPEQLLVDLLTRTVADCRAWMRHDVVPVDEGQWQAICDLTKR
ncbi:MAG TPA: hypothetical protein VF049_15365 [Nocardioidaceae bacterium]|jgi:hypothetical protein